MKNYEEININSIQIHGPQMVNTQNGILVPNGFLTRDNREILTNSVGKKRVLTIDEKKGFVSIALVTISGIVLMGFSIFKVISIFMFK